MITHYEMERNSIERQVLIHLYQFLFEFTLKEKDDFWNFTNQKKLA